MEGGSVGQGGAGRAGNAERSGETGRQAGQAGIEPEAVGSRAEAGRPALGRESAARGADFQAGLDPSRSRGDRGIVKAEGMGFEPTTGFPAPHFQCGR